MKSFFGIEKQTTGATAAILLGVVATTIVSIVFLSSVSFKSKKNAATATANTTLQQVSITTTQAINESTLRLVVSFYSIGGGIDEKLHGEFVKFLDSYPKKIAYDPTYWGREGEVDYCLKLSGLSSSEQDNFLKKAKEMLSKSTLVHVYENATCVHKPRKISQFS
jgi:hypothetical protein